ncbi:cytochrome b/b6 domain-containing protein [Salipiger mucosus]|uniref:Cytochrome b561 n=1 Tax=Salipiger mucosus DSM 16094 TaxID=1123237 RepID=S9S6R8_9RHOB|nr:cytochrome b/b6 domain-containing protein [Salipiger mucosus]EPX81904.1 Cytochrome b561 [Salipiger mucosus DSM 16094]
MSLANTSTSYGRISRSFHWLIALGIAVMIPLGWIAHWWSFDTESQLAVKALLFSVHKTVGIAIFVIALARILWALTQPRPAPLHPERRAETALAEAVHWTLYASLVLVPLTGWIEHAATEGFAPILWPLGQDLPLVPNSPALAETFAGLHFLFQWVLTGALVLHIAGAVKHAAVDRDDTLARMARGRSAGRATAHGAGIAPAVLSLAVWAAVIAGGAAAGYFTEDEREAPALAQVDSAWQVEEGALGLRVSQMGSAVEGRFTDWTADIDFTRRDAPGKAGEVTVQVSVPSLELGSVTSQALGPDFFAAETHPTATFSADIMQVADGYEAQGTLALKGAEVPLTLPFTLMLEDDRAEMSGRATLDRRDFGIGENMTDPEQLGFEVAVIVELTARRADPAQ